MEEPVEELSVEQAMREIPYSEYQGKRVAQNPVGKLEFSLNKDGEQLFRLELDRDGSITTNIPQVSVSAEGLVFYAKQYFDSIGEAARILPMSPEGVIVVDSEDSSSLFILRSRGQGVSQVEVGLQNRRLDKKDVPSPIEPLIAFVAQARGIPSEPVQRTFDSILRERTSRPPVPRA